MTIRKLAEITGYSISTVSKAFSNKKDVSEIAKRDIIEKAKELGCYEKFCKENYDRKIIAVLCPEAHSQFYSKILSVLNTLIEERGGTMAISLTDFSKSKEEKLLGLYSRNNRADGIMLLGNGNIVKKYSPVPVVSFHGAQNQNADVVNLDSSYGFCEAVQYLKALEHERIAFIGEKYTLGKAKHFISAMENAGLEVDNSLVLTNPNSRFEQAGFDSMNELLRIPSPPTAVITAYDNVALGAIQAIEKHGLKVPEDISVIGCDDMGIASYYKIALSSINLNIEEACKMAVETLFYKIFNPSYCIIKSVNVHSKFIDRKTVTTPKNNHLKG